jgi:hypothetical protein
MHPKSIMPSDAGQQNRAQSVSERTGNTVSSAPSVLGSDSIQAPQRW